MGTEGRPLAGGRGPISAGRPPLIVIAGATATGKTDLAIRLAETLAGEGRPAEIISADSRQVYRGLDIGTAKATPNERARVCHHALDLVDPEEPFTVADFVRASDVALEEIAQRSGIALLVGGTGLYLRAVGRGLDVDALPHDAAIRATLEAELTTLGLAPLVARLQAIAPLAAARVELRNPRRVVRALEIATLRGDMPPPPPLGYPGPVLWLGLTVEPAVHRDRIARRAAVQFGAGLLAEAAALRERHDPSLPAFSAIGYREAWAVLDGQASREQAIELDARRNLAFAKRQRTWFRTEPDLDWLDATEAEPVPGALARIGPFLDRAYATGP